MRPYTGAMDWLKYHPLSKFPSLQYVPAERPVCIAGRVLSLGPRTEDVKPYGSNETVPKTSYLVRAEDRIVQVEARRDTSGCAQEVKEGCFYFIEAIKRVEKRQDGELGSILRYQKNKKHSACEDPLLKTLQDTAPDGWEGATTIQQCFQVAPV